VYAKDVNVKVYVDKMNVFLLQAAVAKIRRESDKSYITVTDLYMLGTPRIHGARMAFSKCFVGYSFRDEIGLSYCTIRVGNK
jgi:hypothetical protein